MSEKKEFPCDVCGSKDAVALPYVELYTAGQPIHVCKGCGFVYVRHRRGYKEIADSWSNECYGEHYTARIPAVVARQTYVADFLDVKIGLKGKQLVDIGAGEGQFLEIARRYGANVFGIEPSQANCQLLSKNGFENFCGTIEDYRASKNFRPESADIVTIMWTVENCVSARSMIDIACNIVKPNGKVLIATGSRILVPFKKPLGLYLSSNASDLHCFRFSATTLKRMFASCGLTPIEENHYLDSDALCVIATKGGKPPEFAGDNWRLVYDFFERWHKESLHYEKASK